MDGKGESKPGRKHIGMIEDLLEKERCGELKKRAEERQE